MSLTDPIADMLIRIKNANTARIEKIEMPNSNVKKEIAKILFDEGFIENYEVVNDNAVGSLKIYLKFDKNKKSPINGIKRVSKPSLRVYAKKNEIPKVLGGFGIAIISTSKGIMTGEEARKLGIGGEVICYIW